MSHSRSCTLFALLCALTLASPGVEAGGTTDPAVIKALAAKAYVWGLGPQFIEQSSKYNTIIGAPFNSLKYGFEPAAWNTDATNAGDASVVYVSGFINFDRNPELVLTVPPSRVSSSSGNQYYVAAYYDAYANTIGSIGTRTTPSDAPTSYLLVGPNSPYANTATANIGGYEYPVVASDTTVNFLLIRILTNTLIDPPDSTSVPNVVTGIVQKFALNSLPEFESAGHQPVYPSSFVLPPPTSQQMLEAAPFKNKPTEAVQFFNQLGNAVATNPIPSRDTGLSGTRVSELPAWIVPQYGAPIIYRVPSYGQQEIFDSFAPLGLTAQGFRIPRGWGQAQLQALQEGYCTGQQLLRKFAGQTTSGPLPESDCAGQQIPGEFAGNTTSDANTWTIVNDVIGTYPNNALGYLFRSLIVLEGGVANIPLDAVYPTLGGLNGDNTYKLTFTRPSSVDGAFPVEGIYPPIVGDRVGKLKGFWSIHVYATSDEPTAPFIAQTSVLNTSYSTEETAVLSVDSATHCMTVSAPSWGTLGASTPILFGGDATAYGLTPNTVYYVASDPSNPTDAGCSPSADNTTYTFQISARWLQQLSDEPNPVPIQNTGHHGPIVDLLSPAGAGALTYGIVKPVTQLGSSQLAAGQLAVNPDGSLTIWLGPTPPPDAPLSNWIPTPSTAYYRTVYPWLYPKTPVSTAFQLTLRLYYPTPGDDPPSILPCPACAPPLPESYIPPTVESAK